MKQFIRSVTLLGLVGGWALASAAVYVVRTPSKVLIIPKDRLEYKDTYVDTRAWTLNDDRAHTEVVARLIHLGRTDILAHTVNTNSGSVETQLTAAAANPIVAANHDSTTIVEKTRAEINTIGNGIKSKL